MKNHIKVGDRVQVIAGEQKGFIGNILAILKNRSFVILDNVLPRIKYIKNQQGGEAQKKELPTQIHVSNVMLWDQEKNQKSRIGYKRVDGKKIRYFKKSNTLL